VCVCVCVCIVVCVCVCVCCAYLLLTMCCDAVVCMFLDVLVGVF